MLYCCRFCTAIDDVDDLLATMFDCSFGLFEDNDDGGCLIMVGGGLTSTFNHLSLSCKILYTGTLSVARLVVGEVSSGRE